MSTSEPSTPAPSTSAEGLPRLASAAASVAAVAFAPVQAAAFWAAVALPLAYLPLLATGVAWDQPSVLAAVLTLNGLAFVLGHGYEAGEDPERA